MKKRILFLMIIIALILPFGIAHADEITLPDGQTLNIDNLSQTEITQAINTAKKSMSAKKPDTTSVMNMMKEADPAELEAWGKLISGTIKTICEDLSITVNDFVKTPVGIGIAGLIAYKIAGKDLLENVLDIAIMVPLWFLMTGIILFLGWYFFSAKTIYDKIYDDAGKVTKESPRRIPRYPWRPAKNSDELTLQMVFAGVLVIAQVFGTIVTLFIVLT